MNNTLLHCEATAERRKILSFLKNIDFEMEDEHLEDFIMFMNYKLYGVEPNYEERPRKYFKTLLFLFNKEII